jgi:uncharacterized protein YndB with AHSA1/START domain
MEISIEKYLGSTVRKVKFMELDGRRASMMSLTRTYDTSTDDLWDAVTNPERLPRWFAPVSGDLKLGGRYSIEGNADGEVLECDPPSRLRLTWEFGDAISWVNLNVSEDAEDGARLTVEHIAHIDNDHWDQFGAGAVGVGWDLSLVGLGEHLAKTPGFGRAKGMEWMVSEDGKTFIRGSSDGWLVASISAGADADWARKAAANTSGFYTGEMSM